MLTKLVSLAVGVMIASVLALPAVAAHGKPANAEKAANASELSPCKQAVLESAKTFHASRKAELRTFIKAQRDLRVAFNGPGPGTDGGRADDVPRDPPRCRQGVPHEAPEPICGRSADHAKAALRELQRPVVAARLISPGGATPGRPVKGAPALFLSGAQPSTGS